MNKLIYFSVRYNDTKVTRIYWHQLRDISGSVTWTVDRLPEPNPVLNPRPVSARLVVDVLTKRTIQFSPQQENST